MTTYIVLREREKGDGPSVVGGATLYQLIGTYNTSGPSAAIRALAGDSEGTYIAVPERNWTVIEADLEQPPPKMRLTEQEPELPPAGQIPGQAALDEEPEPEPVAAA